MSKPLLREDVEFAARALTTALVTPLGVEVATPIIYPNGDSVLVIVAQDHPRYVVHDASLGSMYLMREGMRVNKEMGARIASMATRYECRFEGGRITRACEVGDISVSIMLVANASRAVGDLAAETRRQSENNFRDVLTERVREIVGARLRENESFKGESGTSYRVANTILDEQASTPVAFVVPVPTRSAVNPQFRELFDLRAAFPHILRTSVFNEEGDFRIREDGWVLRQVGNIMAFGALRSELTPALDALVTDEAPSPTIGI